MNLRYLTGILLLALCFSCQNTGSQKISPAEIEAMRKDSARLADSAKAADERVKEEFENRNANFDFTGKWSNDLMNLEFSGDSARFNTGSGEGTWCKTNFDNTRTPIALTMIKYFKSSSMTAYRMLVEVKDPNTIWIATSPADITQFPATMDRTNTVELKRK